MKKTDLRFPKPGQIMEAAGILHANFDDFVSYFCYSGYDSLMCDATCVFLPKLDMLPLKLDILRALSLSRYGVDSSRGREWSWHCSCHAS